MCENNIAIGKEFEQYINNYLKKESDEKEIFDYICNNYNVIIFGGGVRDFLYKRRTQPRDLDIILDNKPQNNIIFKKFLSGSPFNKMNIKVVENQFEGLKIISNDKIFDIWFLEDTWAFKKGLLKANRENLLKSVYLNIDSYGYCWNEHLFICGCHKKGMLKEIDIVLEENPNVLLNLIRAKVASNEYKIPLSEKIVQKIKLLYKEPNFEGRCEFEQLRHYGKLICRLDREN